MQQPVRENSVEILDLNFLGIQKSIAAYLIPHNHGAILIECGPGSTIAGLVSGLQVHGYTPSDVTDVLLTHIHLDHGGASGWLARQGARIHVHPAGAPHLIAPEKLLASARRIYGEAMDRLWGEFLPVPESSIEILKDGDVLEIGDRRFRAIDTPGHANHHLAYLYNDICFSGDVGGVRMQGVRHLRLPMPPPEFDIENWKNSVIRLQTEQRAGSFTRIAPTHYGIFEDTERHLNVLRRGLDEVGIWMEAVLPGDPSVEEINEKFTKWTEERSMLDGLTPEQLQMYEAANPTWMSAPGMQRYWRKHRE